MSKRGAKSQKKQRSKRYTGEDAAVKGVKVTRVKAVKKSPLQEWWSEKGTGIKVRAAIFAVLFVVGYALFALITWIF